MKKSRGDQMVLRLRITIALLDGEHDSDMQRAVRRLMLNLAAELVRASIRLDGEDEKTERRDR